MYLWKRVKDLLVGGNLTFGSGASFDMGVAGLAKRKISAASILVLTPSADDKVVLLDALTGSTVTLPAATGSGARIDVVVNVVATSNNHIVKVANSTDIMVGAIRNVDTDTGDAVANFAAAATSDTVTLNRSTTGSVRKGERLSFIDAAAGFWTVDGVLLVTGAPATPFSATV